MRSIRVDWTDPTTGRTGTTHAFDAPGSRPDDIRFGVARKEGIAAWETLDITVSPVAETGENGT